MLRKGTEPCKWVQNLAPGSDTPARGRRIDDACGDSPPPPGNWDVRLGAASASCGQRTYTNIVKNRAQRLNIEARRPRKCLPEGRFELAGALLNALGALLRRPPRDTPAALGEDPP